MINRTAPDGYRQATTVCSYSLALIASSMLVACGGGGGGGGMPTTAPPPPPSNSAPTLTGNLSPSFSENSDISFFLSVDDADGDTVTITIGNSNDGQFFTLETGTGEIRSTQQFDFENPLDVNGDNVYVQSVTLNDGTASVDTEVRVVITNQDEAPTCDPVPTASVDENVTGLLATLSGVDPDDGDDDNAVFENLIVSDIRLDGLVSIDSVIGAVNLVTPLDAEAFEDDFSFEVSADYRTNDLRDRCSVVVELNDLPSRVTSGVLFDDNLSAVQQLPDLDGDGLGEFWMADHADLTGSAPITGTLVFGQTFADALAANGAANIDLTALDVSQRLRISATINLGSGNATSATVASISDMDGDGSPDLLFMANQPPNDGLDATRRPWGFVVFAATIAGNTSGALDLSTLTVTEGFSLTGPVDFNGGSASYVVADLDGIAGDEIAIALPGAIGVGAETGKLFVVDGSALADASGNLDFDLSILTRLLEGSFDIDATPVIGDIALIADLDVDGSPELMMQSQQDIAIIPSINLIGSGGGPIESLNPLLIDLEGDSARALGQADVDGDLVADLLLVRGDGAANSKQAAVVFGDTLTPIIASDSEIALNKTNFAPGDYVDLTSGGTGGGSEPVRLTGVGDLDGDGREEVAFSLLDDAESEPGEIYIIRGAALSDLATVDFNVDALTAAQGTELVRVPSVFTSLSTQVSLAPDVDGDGLNDLYLRSFERLASDPAGLAIIIKSSDIAAALMADEVEVDIEALFFDETPVVP